MSIGSSYSVGRSTPGPARPLPHARAAVPLGLQLLAVALCGLFALVLTAAVFVRTYPGQWLDGVLLPRAERGGGYEQQTVLVGPARSVLATFGSPTLIAALLGVVLLVGVLRRRLVAGVVGVGLVVCVVLVAGAVKSALPRPELQIESSTTHNSFPSGHVAAATALLLAFMLVLPGWARRWLAVPGAVAVSVIASATMIAGWHRFSDVLGGVLLGVTLFCLAAAALAAWPGDRHAAGGSDGGGLWRRLAETGVGLVVLVWALVVVVPGLAASVQRGLLVAIVATAAAAMFLVGAVVFLVRSTDFAARFGTGSPERSQPSTEFRNIS
ncbi:phosphatase PAP2 family protein [Micromonospora foliorum]|uniref:phosphatase PAP2 family protein n=1 Tax=Micromonospora foliorum TaxID=2911210 RepID=UPI001EE8FA17|nr:phosphatase PAP2 family protein [Micromonospora foliorum]MCG5437627.1 phosphatase PAP2 family protein [Micromonospora foliorum]